MRKENAAPGNSTMTKEKGTELYAKDRVTASWKQSIEKLKEKWTAFTTEIIRTIAEEEMKISREEFDKQLEARARQRSQFKRSPLRAGGRGTLLNTNA